MSQFKETNLIILFEAYCKKMDIDGKELTATISDVLVKVKVASTPNSQAKGYMGSDKSPLDNEGMLFIYDEPQSLSFWMKKVKFPLDIIFFDTQFNYINHETMDPAHDVEEFNIPKYTSHKPARFAVELPAGWCKKNMKSDCKLSF